MGHILEKRNKYLKISYDKENPNLEPYLNIYIKDKNLSSDYFIKLINSIETLLYESLIQTIHDHKVKHFKKIEHSTNSVESHNLEVYNYLDSIENKFLAGYYSFLVNKYYPNKISCLHFEKNIANKFWGKPDFDYEEFILWIRSRSPHNLIIKEIYTGNSYNFILDFSQIVLILSLYNYPIIGDMGNFILERVKQAIDDKFPNPKSAQNELISIIDGNVIINEPRNPGEYDFEIEVGEASVKCQIKKEK